MVRDSLREATARNDKRASRVAVVVESCLLPRKPGQQRSIPERTEQAASLHPSRGTLGALTSLRAGRRL